jgi:pyruvate dehydrogenase E2 component (dihydrolipoamide acetyltransferase)
MTIKEVIIPDLGGAQGVEVIEILVGLGDAVEVDASLISLESDKATMEVPSPFAGVVKSIKATIGDQMSEGDLVLTLEVKSAEKTPETTAPLPKTAPMTVVEVRVPDVGGEAVDVIEVLVKKGDVISLEESVITLESDKASMEVPAPFAGTVESIQVKVGDKVSEGTLVLTMSTQENIEVVAVQSIPADVKSVEKLMNKPVDAKASALDALTQTAQDSATSHALHASPVVRRIASEFGIDLHAVAPTGEKNRITKEDVQLFVKQRLAAKDSAAGGLNVAAMPVIDFSQFGAVETKNLTKINRLTGEALHRNWLTIPHVTQFDEVDITDMEAFRQQNKAKAEKQGFKLTPLIFIMKAVVAGLKQFPKFNASLAPGGQALILKKYFNVGIAVDTPNGLVVPVVRDVDQKSVFDIAKELGEISLKARNGKLLPRDMQGGCMTISSLGGIGGSAFTPIVNAPEVAILGVSKSLMKPVYQEGAFVPRLMLPLSLSYDHRVIDGADGARFITLLNQMLSDLRQLIL